MLRRARRLLVALVVVALLALGAAWATTPGVDDARARVDARLAAHAGTALDGEVASRGSPPPCWPPRTATSPTTSASTGAERCGHRSAWSAAATAGGSTVHQQLARVVYEDGATDPLAKARAVVLAVKLDRAWSNEELLRMYLDAAYFGHGFYGVDAAARGYFERRPASWTGPRPRCSSGLVQAPSAYDPLAHPELARARQAHVLERLVDVGTLARADADRIAATSWGLVQG